MSVHVFEPTLTLFQVLLPAETFDHVSEPLGTLFHSSPSLLAL